MRGLKIQSTILKSIISIAVLVLGFRACYYGGSPFSTCKYSEKEIPLSPKIKKSKTVFVAPAVVVTGGKEPSFSCLPEMGSISNEIVEQKYAHNYRTGQQRTITPSDKIILEPIKLMSVEKHGFTSLDSSPPILYLILKDMNGTLYQVPTVGLGLNEGDEFLKAVSDTEEFLLNPDTKFIE
jgi:hypothetical protein